MRSIPKEFWPDQTLSLLREGNTFISTRCEKHESPVFQTRLLFERTLCLSGKDAAKLFYDQSKFSRQSAAPSRLQKTLTGKKGVQGLDGKEHEQRKAMFMQLMSKQNIGRLITIFETHWRQKWESFSATDHVSLYDVCNIILMQAACEWSGISLEDGEVEKRTEEMVKMIESPASIGLTYIKGVWARKSAEKWALSLIDNYRSTSTQLNQNQALSVFALQKLNQRNLDREAAAVDLLNVIRPIVAIGRYICFATLAIHKNPRQATMLAQGDDTHLYKFAQEVRRFYPYFPFVAAIVKHDFEWEGFHFPEGMRVLLDLHGTNNEDSSWESPKVFNPERFADRQNSKFDYIPQGGGDYDKNHRCAGEEVTLEIMKSAIRQLVVKMQYEVDTDDTSIDFSVMPSLPKNGFMISNVKLKPDIISSETKLNEQPHTTSSKAGDAIGDNESICGEEDPGASVDSSVDNQTK